MGSMDWDGMVERGGTLGNPWVSKRGINPRYVVYVVSWVSKFGSHPNSAKPNFSIAV